MFDNFKKILIVMAALLAVVTISFVTGYRRAENGLVLPQQERVDTLFIFDTIVSEKPVFKEKIITERILVPVRDTIRVRDTLYLYAERHQIHWKDSLSDVYASGIQVDIDSVIHYLPTQVVSKEREVLVKARPKWSVGLSAGYGVNADGRMSPYVGVGLTYNLFSW